MNINVDMKLSPTSTIIPWRRWTTFLFTFYSFSAQNFRRLWSLAFWIRGDDVHHVWPSYNIFSSNVFIDVPCFLQFFLPLIRNSTGTGFCQKRGHHHNQALDLGNNCRGPQFPFLWHWRRLDVVWVICGDPSITCTLVMEKFGLQVVDAVLDVEVDPIYPRGCDQMEGHWSPITTK